MYGANIGSRIVVQFEDWKNPFPALERYQYKYSCFNDDIQGTGAVILAGLINALKVTGVPLKDQRIVSMGAGSAGVGVCKQIAEYFENEGLTANEARKCFYLVDTKVCISTLPAQRKPVYGTRVSSQTTEAIILPSTRNTLLVTTIMANSSNSSLKLLNM